MRALGLFLAICALSTLATAQQNTNKSYQYKGNVYGLANLGACIHGYSFLGGGGGGEVFVYKGMSLGAEGSYSAFSDGPRIGFVTGQIGHHYGNRNKSVGIDPFISYGAGLGFNGNIRRGYGVASNFGGGATYWFKERVGLRLEGRAMGINVQELIFVARVGISFR